MKMIFINNKHIRMQKADLSLETVFSNYKQCVIQFTLFLIYVKLACSCFLKYIDLFCNPIMLKLVKRNTNRLFLFI
jgi:hypothetical protein